MGATVATHPPRDREDYRARLLSPAFWRPLLELVGARERIEVGGARPAKPVGTFPTFVCGSCVAKLYTQLFDGQTGFSWNGFRLPPSPPK